MNEWCGALIATVSAARRAPTCSNASYGAAAWPPSAWSSRPRSVATRKSPAEGVTAHGWRALRDKKPWVLR
jgi:hypothetical protein